MSRSAYICALELLARREHSKTQLVQKLAQRGFVDEREVNEALAKLETQGYQSDQRFAEAYARSRSAKGYGERRITMELRQKGVADELIRSLVLDFDDNGDFENSVILRAWQKKFKNFPLDLKEKSKQTRYLMYRGFAMNEIEELFAHIKNRSDEDA